MTHPAPFVWIEGAEHERLTHVYFRRELALAARPKSAVIHLFAQTFYELRVNGVLVGRGPARFYPEYPEYDSHDLARYLRKGENVIAVHAASMGVATFHHLAPASGGLVCWGEVADAKGRTHDLSTGENWLCLKSAGHDPMTPAFSFAIGPTEQYDARLDPAGWDNVPRPEAPWHPPVALANQDAWGPLRPRSIAPLTQDERVVETLLWARPHIESEEIVSFRLNQERSPAAGRPGKATAFAYTWIHSPREQSPTAGAWWGEYYLNGQALGKREQRPNQILRQDMALPLHEGWNLFFASYGMSLDIWQMHLAVPREAELRFSPNRRLDDPVAFRVASPLPHPEAEAVLAQCPPAEPETLAPLANLWHDAPRRDTPVCPMHKVAWTPLGENLGIPLWQTTDLVVPGGEGRSFLFDLGAITLGRLFIEVDAPAGTVLDVAFAEELRNDRADLGKNVLVTAGERHVTRGGRSRQEFFFRRGRRYVELAVSAHSVPVTIHRVGIVSEIYPYERIGSFECSDPYFNTLWDWGYNTLRLCSEDVIVDCPWRERTLYGGDLLPEMATTLVATGDLTLVRRCVELFLQGQNPETGGMLGRVPEARAGGGFSDYPLIVLLIAEWYCRVTGDRDYAERCRPVFERLMHLALTHRQLDGTFLTERGVFIDHLSMAKHGTVCALNTLAARTFAAWGAMLRTLGREDEAQAAEQIGRETAEVVRRRFWDAETRAFADLADPTPEMAHRPEHHFVASNAWPLMFGVASAEQAQAAVFYLHELLRTFDPRRDSDSAYTTPYGAFYLLGGLYEVGHEAFAEECMRHLWSAMLARPSGTIWEQCDPDKSLVHAWSTAPNYYLSTRALGVRLGFPDATALDGVLIAPQSATLTWARGAVPHPRGLVKVEWRVVGERLELDYVAPRGVKVQVKPEGRLAKLELWVNGKRAPR